MSELEYNQFLELDNATLLNSIRDVAGNDYQSRIPNADKANMDETISGLLNYTPSMNEFLYNLVNVIGMQLYADRFHFTNPLAKFKRGMLQTGDTIEIIMNGLLEAHHYDPQAEYLEEAIFGTEKPETEAEYHKINNKRYYKLSIKEYELRKAFTTTNGLAEFVTGLMGVPQKSDQNDEFLITTSLLKTWHNYGGYFNVNIPDISSQESDSADSRYALRRMRELADTLPFPSRRYNPAHLPMTTDKSELELIITPEANAAMDVEALAGAFNIGMAEFDARKTIIPAEFIGIDGFQAMLTTKDFFVIADTLLQTNTVNNPVGLNTNWILHHQQVVSASRFAPSILFTSTEPSTPIIINDTPVVTVSVPTFTDAGGDAATSLERGFTYQTNAVAATNPVGGDNDAVRLVLVGATSPRTRIWQTGIITVAIDETAHNLTVNVVAVDNDSVKNTVTVPVIGEYARLWPNPEILEDIDNDGLLEVTPDVPVANTTTHKVKIPTTENVQYKNNGTNVASGSTVDYTTVTAVITVVANTGFELTAGAPATWTYTHP